MKVSTMPASEQPKHSSLRLAWLNSHPGEKLDDIAQMKKLAPFFCHVAYPRTGILNSINFGDSHKNVTGESSMLLAYAMGAEDPATLWYATQIVPGQHREGFHATCPWDSSTLPDLSKAPGIPDCRSRICGKISAGRPCAIPGTRTPQCSP